VSTASEARQGAAPTTYGRVLSEAEVSRLLALAPRLDRAPSGVKIDKGLPPRTPNGIVEGPRGRVTMRADRATGKGVYVILLLGDDGRFHRVATQRTSEGARLVLAEMVRGAPPRGSAELRPAQSRWEAPHSPISPERPEVAEARFGGSSS